MTRIAKSEHARILDMVDGERRSVADVAAQYGCTKANIYALLGKLRRNLGPGSTAEPRTSSTSQVRRLPVSRNQEPASSTPGTTAEDPVSRDLFAPGDPAVEAAAPTSAVKPRGLPKFDDDLAARDRVTAEAQSSSSAPDTSQQAERGDAGQALTVVARKPPRGAASKATGIGATLAKPGVALLMRTADGEDTSTPFRSLDDLLSAIKPILRAAARSPDAVWFSIQPVDLASLDSE